MIRRGLEQKPPRAAAAALGISLATPGETTWVSKPQSGLLTIGGWPPLRGGQSPILPSMNSLNIS